jgi:hypothetical protein
MAATDWPFSVTSKFLDAGGAEHLVTVRGQNLEAFAARLQEAATLFPYAGFTNGNHHQAPHQPAQPPTPIDPPPIVKPIVTGDPNLDAQYRDAAARINAKANTPKCSIHQRPMRPSRNGGWFCPAKNGDGTYCQTRAA